MLEDSTWITEYHYELRLSVLGMKATFNLSALASVT